jgi:hypothetical protein
MAAALATDMNRPDFESETFEAPQRWPKDSGRAGFGFGLGFVSQLAPDSLQRSSRGYINDDKSLNSPLRTA